MNLSEKFKLSPDLVAFLAAQGVDHYVTDETELPAEKVSQLLGFNPLLIIYYCYRLVICL